MHSVGRRLGKGYDLCMCYTTASTESTTVVSQRLQGPVLSASPYTLRLCANPIAVSQLGVTVRLVSVLHRDTTRTHVYARHARMQWHAWGVQASACPGFSTSGRL